MTRQLRKMLAAAALACLLPAASAQPAEPWPSRPIRIVVGFPPGGSSDAMARLLATELADDLKVAVVVDNRPGAGGVTATQAVARSAPDGYTLQLATAGSYTIAPLLQSLPYDPARDLQPIALLATYPNVLVASAASGLQSLEDLLARAKAQPGKLNYASSGTGTTPHLAFEYLNMLAGTKVAHIPYKGNGPAVNDLVGGQVDLMIGDPSALLPHAQSGKVRILGATSRSRSPLLPDIRTLSEAGVTGYDVSLWLGLTGPAGLPVPTVDRLNASVGKALAKPQVAERMRALWLTPAPGTPAQFAALMAEERRKWADVIRRNNIQDRP